MKLILYHFENCPYCGRVEEAIERFQVKGIEHRDILKEPKYREELVAMTGKKQVPCLVVDGKPIFESLDIIKFLESNFEKK